jgi:DMSO/TMAO reductase YedYZ molybdopterin-dependent catalytic subunit
MSSKLGRRSWLKNGSMAAGGLLGIGAAYHLAGRFGLIPPDSGGIWGPGETLTYATQRLLMAGHSMAREFSRSEISKVVPVSGPQPKTETYQRLLFQQFRDWRLTIDGLVARPAQFSLEEIKRMPATTQITHQACEEGWSFIAAWSGVRLSSVLNQVGILPSAKWIVFYAYDRAWDSLDLAEALHPQTLLAYNLNGEDLPPDHGAPIRVRVARQLGYKSVKYLRQITLVESLGNVRDGRGSNSPSEGYSWFAGI